MPELPDVERARKLLHARCVGRKIVGVDAADDSIVFVGKTRAEVARHLQGHSVTGTGRRGKQFWLLLTGGSALLLHFGMTGEVHIRGEPTAHYRKIETAAGDQWPPRFTKLELEFDGGSKVAYTDPRRLGRIRIHTGDIAECPAIAKLGFDPIIDPPEPTAFAEAVRRRRTPIKALLLNQEFSAGVGNWIADEVLFQSRIHPAQMANSLSETQTGELLRQIKYVCSKAVEANADHALFPRDWLFHRRWSKGQRQQPVLADGRKISFVTVGGRTSAFVPDVQVLSGAPSPSPDTPSSRPNTPNTSPDTPSPSPDAPSTKKRRKRSAR